MATSKITKKDYYNGNKNIKADGVQMEYTEEQVREYIKCSNDPIYFIKKYVKIVNVDSGIVPFKLYSYQERIIRAYHANRKVVVKSCRQSGKTQTTSAYFLWLIVFQSEKIIAIMANKAALAREILSRVQFSYENLPFWMQPGIKEWNKGSILLSNNSKIITSATSPNAARGNSATILYIDEISFIPENICEEFLASVFPIVSSGKETKIFLSSTPKGRNTFYKIWTEATQGTNGFVPVEAHWYENPNRDQEWLEDQRKTLGEVKFNQEVLTQFIGSSYTLISGTKLSTLTTIPPVYNKDNLKIYHEPDTSRSYVMTVDTSEGVHQNASAFTVFDITELPYKVVATYKDNTISPSVYPSLIDQVGKKYNFAYALVESNSVGAIVANCLFYELEYEHLYFTQKETLNEGSGYPGVKTTKKVKSIGTSCLRDLIEQDQLFINSDDILQELSVFVKKGTSYATSEPNGVNDDLVSTLWLFAWLTKQPIFGELTNTNIRAILAKKAEDYISEHTMSFGVIDTGLPEENVEPEFDMNSIDPINRWMFG